MFLRTCITQLKRDKFMMAVAVLGIVLVTLAVLGPTVLPNGPAGTDIGRRLQAPFWASGEGGILGTDQLGRPVWLRILHGLRTSYLISLLAVAVGASLGVLAGLISGYYGGWIDSVLSRLGDIQLSMPSLLLVMILVSIARGGPLGGGLIMIGVLGLNSWMIYARIARNLVLRQRSSDFVQSTMSLGARPRRIIWLHILPNSLPSLVAIGTMEVARLMLSEATLSFLGFGIQPPNVSLGLILAEGQQYLVVNPWVATSAGITLVLAVLTINLMGNWIERQLDPLQRMH